MRYKSIIASEVRKLFAASLKQWRRQRGFSQEELAERSNLHRTYISDVERGARNLSLESISRLAGALDISIAKLFYTESKDLLSAPAVFEHQALEKEFVDILLVEDNPDDVELTLRAFGDSRFANSIKVARDGAEALEFVFGKGNVAGCIEYPMSQIILLDLNLPKVSGLEVLRRLKADKRTRKIPIVILTASEDDKDVEECLKLGAEAFITKPVNMAGLCKVTPQLSMTWALIKTISTASVGHSLNVPQARATT